MNGKEILQKCSEYYDFTMTTYHLVKSTILGPEEDVPFVIEANDSPTSNLLGCHDGFSIHIYLFTILSYYGDWNDNDLKNAIIHVVIHELYHVIQNIDTRRYTIDDRYHREMEDSCNWMTWNYINKFKEVLEEFLEFSVDFKFIEEEFTNPLLKISFLRYKGIDASVWANFINSLVATTSDTGVFPDLEDIIKDSTNCILQLKRRNNEQITNSIVMKYNGEYFYPDYAARDAFNSIRAPKGTVQCEYFKNDYIDVFVINYTMSDIENEETSHLYSPLLRFKEEQ